MNFLGLNISWAKKANGDVLSVDQLVKRLEAIYETASGVNVTPENCERAPTVKAIVRAVTARMAVSPVHVLLKTSSKGRAVKEHQPNHPVEKLLNRPNDWQTRTTYWTDATSSLLRYGNFYAHKARGQTGPIRRLTPLHASAVEPKQDDDLAVSYQVILKGGRQRVFVPSEVHHVRLEARDYLIGNSPVTDVRETIALEIAAEMMGASLFGNGALPGLVFRYAEGSQGHKDESEAQEFLQDIQDKFGKRGRFKAMLLPKGIELGDPIGVENDKAQFLQLRQHQRTVIAGAFGCPPHLVGDLTSGKYNNVELQGGEFSTNVILPIMRLFESAMERDLLTDEDRRSGIIIRFNPDAVLRGDFKTRQEGLKIQREAGVINANEWREREDMNPRADDGGEDYYEQGPSGQTPAGKSDPPKDDDDEP